MWGPVHVGACACGGLYMWRPVQATQHLALCMLALVLFQPARTGVRTLRWFLACQRFRLYKCMMFDLKVMSSYFTADSIASLKVSSPGPLFAMGSTASPCAFCIFRSA